MITVAQPDRTASRVSTSGRLPCGRCSTRAETMRLVCWNVEGSSVGVAAQAQELLGDPSPDLIALQEVRRSTLEEWKDRLKARGFPDGQIVTTEHLVGDRKNFLLTASAYPVVMPPSRRPPSRAFEVPFPELVLSVVLRVDSQHELELVNTHVPNGSSNGYRKVEHFEGLYRYLSRAWSPRGRPRILCGDFNSPRKEEKDGTVLTWGQRATGELIRDRGQRWDAAERSVILGLKAFELEDVYRRLHGYGRTPNPISWVPRQPKDSTRTPEEHDREFGRRFDHIFAPPQFPLIGSGYIETWRAGKHRLSDHAAVWAAFDWP